VDDSHSARTAAEHVRGNRARRVTSSSSVTPLTCPSHPQPPSGSAPTRRCAPRTDDRVARRAWPRAEPLDAIGRGRDLAAQHLDHHRAARAALCSARKPRTERPCRASRAARTCRACARSARAVARWRRVRRVTEISVVSSPPSQLDRPPSIGARPPAIAAQQPMRDIGPSSSCAVANAWRRSGDIFGHAPR